MANLELHEVNFEKEFGCFILEHPKISRGADSLEKALKEQNHQISIQRIRGYSWIRCKKRIFQKIHTSPERQVFLPTELACLAGHRKLLRTFLKSKLKYALILEDDVSVNKRLLATLKKVADNLKSDFIFSPFESGLEIPLLCSNRTIDKGVSLRRNIGASRGAYALFFDRVAAEKIYRAMFYYLPADHFYGFQANHGSRNFFLKGNYVELMDVKSTIEEPGLFVRSPIRISILFLSIVRKSKRKIWLGPYALLFLLAHIRHFLSQILGIKAANAWLPYPFGRQIK